MKRFAPHPLLAAFAILCVGAALNVALAGTGRVHPPVSPTTAPAAPLTADQRVAVQEMIDASLGRMKWGPVVVTPPAVVVPPTASTDFIIGVWYQPVSSFGKWKARGINTLVGYENEGGAVTLDEYKHAAAVAGLKLILQADVCRDVDYADPNVVAIMAKPDEPDGVGNVSPAEIQARYHAVKLNTSKPIFINFDGWKMAWRPPADYAAYCQGADWLGMDYYVINRGEGPAAISKMGDRLDLLAQLSPGKRRIACIECSDQNLRVQEWASDTTWGPAAAVTMRGPTATEMAAEIKLATDHGATGIVYFPDVVGKNFEGFDGTPPDLAAAMTSINASLAK